MSNRRTAKTKGLRAALAKKQVRVESFDIPLVDYATAKAAALAVEEASQRAVYTKFGTEDDVKKAVEADLVKCKAALAKCFHRVEFRGLGESAYDALLNEHPLTDEEREAGEKVGENFIVALIVASIVDGDDMTEDDWKAELADESRWPRADKNALFETVLSANARAFTDGIPKG